MPGLGTIINVIAIIVGGLLGSLFGSRFTERFKETLMSASALCVLFLGISGCMQEMLITKEDGLLTSQGTIMVIICFSLGSLIGEIINLEDKMENFGEWLKEKTKNEKDNSFVNGFVVASLTVCVGAMAIVGSIQDGVLGDYSTLAAKAVLDLLIIMIMTASMGKGCIFSAIPVAILQGTVTLLSHFIEPILTPKALSNLSLTGSMLIFCVGVNLVWGKKFKVANMLPTVVLAVVWAIFFP